MRRIRHTAATLTATALLLTGCTGGESGPEPTATDAPTAPDGTPLVTAGALSTCVGLRDEPFQFTDPRDSAIKGFDIDIAELIAARLELAHELIDWVPAYLADLALFDQELCDLAIGSIVVNEENHDVVELSRGYFTANQAVLVLDDSEISAEDDLAGRTLGGVEDSTGLRYAEDDLPDTGIQARSDLASAIQDMVNGDTDGVIGERRRLDRWVSDGGLRIAFEIDTGEEYVIAVRKGNTQLLDTIDQVIAESREDGTYAEIYRTWFDSEPPG